MNRLAAYAFCFTSMFRTEKLIRANARMGVNFPSVVEDSM